MPNNQSFASVSQSVEPAQPWQEVVFIDRGVDDDEFLVQGVRPGVEVHVLEADAIAQMTAVLAGRSDLKVVHVVSHGAPGCLYLGEGELSLTTLGQYAKQLQAWFGGYAAGEKPELLLYGCNVAAGDAGEEFVEKVRQLTGAEVAASKNLTGSSALGGDWDLAYQVGTVQSDLIWTQITREVYTGILGFTAGTPVSTANEPIAIATGDFNGDGKPDIVTANYGVSTVSIGFGNGSGGFLSSSGLGVGGAPHGVAVGDFNGDGRADIAVANSSSSTVSILVGNGTGGFSTASTVGVGARPVAIGIGDFNSDGKADFATANSNGNSLSIRLGNGDGTFTGSTNLAVGSAPYEIVVADFNGDGRADIANVNGNSNTLSVHLANGSGSFSAPASVAVGSAPIGAVAGDFNGDGKADIAVANSGAGSVSILFGTGTGGFSAPTNFSVGGNPYRISTGDFNSDGKVDIATANQNNTVSILQNNGSGAFTSTNSVGSGSSISAVAVADFNGDGKADIATANRGSASASILSNTTPKVTVSRGTAPVEGSNGSFTIALDQPAPTGGLVVNYNLGGTATVGSDYTLNQAASTNITAIAPGSFTIAAGQTTATIAVSAVADGIADPNETIGLNILSGDYFRDSATPRFIAASTPEVGVGTGPVSVTLGDVNGDGKLDLLTANISSNNVSVRLGDGIGGFTDTPNVPVAGDSYSITLGDVNGDGNLDLLTANYAPSNVSVRLGDGLGGFTGSTTVAVGGRPISVTLGDVNRDGNLDFVTANQSSGNAAVRLGDGLGGFTGSTTVAVGASPFSVTLGDVNGDGKLDLLTANNGSNNISVRLGDGLGGFTGSTTVAVGTGPISVTLGDVNGDGRLDLLAANASSNTVSVRLGDGTGGFAGSTDVAVGTRPRSVALQDVNGDGKLDLLTANENSNTVSVRLGDGLGGFAGSTNISVDRSPASVALGDVNGDGTIDLLAANGNSSNVSVRFGQPGADLVISEPSPPVLTLPNAATTYVENAIPTLLATTSTVVDTDSANFDSGTLTVSYAAGGTVDDRLSIRNEGTAAGQIGVSGNEITFAGTAIGTFTGGTGTTDLVITLNANATPANTQALVRNLSYSNVSDDLTNSSRTINLVLTDGDGGTSTAVTQTVNVQGVNDAPSGLAFANITATLAENTNTATRIKVADLTITDDTLGTNTISLTGADAANFEVDGTVLYLKANTVLDFENKTSYSVSVNVDDTAVGATPDLSETFTLSISNVNEVPTGSISIGATATEDTTLTADTTTLVDADGLGELAYQWQEGGEGFSDIAGATSASFTPDDAQVGKPLRLKVSYTDNGGTDETVFSNVTSAVVNVNDAPTGNYALDSTTATEGTALSISPSSSLADPDGIASAIPTLQWQQSFDEGGETGWEDIANATVPSFTPDNAQVGRQLRLKVSYTDDQGTPEVIFSDPTAATASINDAPLGQATIDGTPSEDQALTANTTAITDADGLGSLTYQWQSQEGGEGDFANIAGATSSSFTPGDDEVGDAIRVVVSYTDGQGTAETVTSSATSTVINVNDAPSFTSELPSTFALSRTGTSTLAFTIADVDNTFEQLTVIATSDPSDRFAAGSLIVSGTGNSRTLSITPQLTGNAAWSGSINLALSDGEATINQQLTVTLPDQRAVTDFDSDGTSEILWRSKNNGSILIWKMENNQVSSAATFPATIPDAPWDMAGTADFDGDGNLDLIGRNRETSSTQIWLLDANQALKGQVDVAPTNRPGQEWQIVGIDDFNGDDQADILWRHQTSGQFSNWYLGGEQGGELTGGALFDLSLINLGAEGVFPDLSWQVEATGDFNDDLAADIVWRHQVTGQVSIWQMDEEATLIGGYVLDGVSDTHWKIMGSGDYDGNGKSDLFWQHQGAGTTAIWSLAQGEIVGGGVLGDVDRQAWQSFA